jgi:hypothetical protein
MESSGKTLAKGLQQLKGVSLCSVEFVMDYVQLHFGGPTLTAFTHPYLQVNGTTVTWDADGFKDLLCDLIQVPVASVNVVEGQEAALNFENGTTFWVSLREKDYTGPEALMFAIESGPWWVV